VGGSALTYAACSLALDVGADRLSIRSITDAGATGYAVDYRHTLARFPQGNIRAPLGAQGNRTAGLASRLATATALYSASRVSRDRIMSEVLDDSRLVISRGGVIFKSRSDARAASMLYLRLMPILLASRVGVPVVVYGAHIDDIRYRPARRVAAAALEAAELVVVRDSVSAANAQSLTRSMRRLIVAPDSVFGILGPLCEAVPETAVPETLATVNHAVVCLSGGEREGFAEREKQMGARLATALRMLIARGQIEGVLVLAQRNDASSGDAAEGRRFSDLLGNEASFVDEDLSPTQLMSLYRKAAFVTGTRLHSTILALAAGGLGAPIDMGPNHRIPAVYEQVGLSSLVASEQMSAVGLADHLGTLVEDAEGLRRTTDRAVELARTQLADTAEEIKSVVARTMGSARPRRTS
jgi:polysaccharide pyruvyl transferase WcaK-like protein